MAKITKDIGFSELLEKHPESVEVLMGFGMHCIGCPAAMFETLEQGAMAHGIDVKELVKKINEKLGGEGRNKKDGIVGRDKKVEKDSELSEDEINKKWERMKEKG